MEGTDDGSCSVTGCDVDNKGSQRDQRAKARESRARVDYIGNKNTVSPVAQSSSSSKKQLLLAPLF